jgi:predicted GIY-YIG superfamily endonuclease
MAGRAIRIFLVDGTPTGLRAAELGLSTIKAFLVPRGSLQDFAKRDESRRTGTYVLVGVDPETPGRAKIYVGEGDEVIQRIVAHDKDEGKDFWDRVVVLVSKDQNLTKAHVRYLEARLVALAKEAKRSTVDNKTDPVGGQLPEADTAEMEEFIDQAKILLAVLGVNALDPAGPGTTTSGSESHLTLTMSGSGFNATCALADGEFIVKAGSVARKQEADSIPGSARALRKELLSSGVLIEDSGNFKFTQDYAFRSASGAAQLVAGASVNGRAYWQLSDGRTFAEWQDEQIGDVAS